MVMASASTRFLLSASAAISYLDIPDLYLYKLFSILFDILLAWGVLRNIYGM